MTTYAPVKTPKEHFLQQFERESATTLRVIQAYPAEQSELKPHEKLKSARELAAMFTMEQAAIESIVNGSFTFPPTTMPAIPEKWADVLRMFEDTRRKAIDAVRSASDEDLASRTATFPTGPKQVGPWPVMDLIWYLLYDQIHHRGQFSIYLRLAGAKVPSIYGPTADESWR
jgi:uncharacterized damage-inducible protein DinB